MSSYEKQQKQAEKLEHNKKYVEAATLWEKLHNPDRAINAYKKGGRGDRAARLLEIQGRQKEAAAMYASYGLYMQSAGIYEKIRAYDQAARSYLRANQREHAAVMCEKGEMFSDAAKIYYSLSNYKKSIQLYEQAGDSNMAQEIATRHGIQSSQSEAPPETQEEVQQIETFIQHLADGFVDERQIIEAIVHLLRHQRVEDAARIYSHCREDIGYPVMTAVAGQKELELVAAKMFFKAKDYHKAAQLLDSMGEYEKAASLYEHSDDFESAGENYAKVGNFLKAAEMHERSGRHFEAAELFLQVDDKERAAVNFERSLNYFMAGKLFYQLNKGNKALQVLQRVPPTEPSYYTAVRMIGDVLEKGGYIDLAVNKYVEITAEQELNDKIAPIFYHLALLYEKKRALSEAKNIFEKVLAWNFNFEDVQKRLSALGNLANTPPETSAPSTPTGATGSESGTPLVTMMDGFEFLSEIKLFQALSLEEIRVIYHMAQRLQFAPGQMIIEQDVPGQALYIVRQGHVLVKKVTPSEDIQLARLGPGAPIGEMSLFDDAPTSARVLADDQVDAFVISKADFQKLLGGSDRLALRVYRAFVDTLVDRLRSTTAAQAAKN